MAGVSAELWSVGAPRRGVLTAVRTREQELSDTVALWYRDLARHACMLCGDGPTAEDVVAEAVADVWPRWRNGHVDGLVPYICKTTRPTRGTPP
jgi:DNA-directed RNA polymerase specialized sigma24 family protein